MMDIGYKVSVIIPVYNTEKYLRDCIESVLVQSLKGIEVICIDDGSTDNSYAVLKEYERQHNHIKIFQQENKRQGAARNKGIELAKGEYIFFLDSDDYLDQNALEILYTEAVKNDLELLTYDAKVEIDDISPDGISGNYNRSHLGIDVNRVWNGKEYFNQFYQIGGVFVSPCLLFIKKDILTKKGIRFTEKVYYEDNSFAIDTFWTVNRMRYLPRQLYNRRYRKDSVVTSQYTDIHLNGACKISEMAVQYLITERKSIEQINSLIAYNCEKALVLLRILREYSLAITDENKSYIKELCIKLIENSEITGFKNFNLELGIYYKNILSILINHGYIEEGNLLAKVNKIEDYLRIKVKQAISELKRKLNFKDEEKNRICVYGTGKIAKRFIQFLSWEWDSLIEHLIFTETEVRERENDKNTQEVISLKEIKDYAICSIILASIRYEKQMRSNIEKLYGDQYKCLSYGDIIKVLI